MKGKALLIAALTLILIVAAPLAVSATGSSTTTDTTTTATTTTTQTKTTKETTTTTTYVISTSPTESLGSITFKTSNSKRIEVGKSTYLYLTIKDMDSSTITSFSCSNTSIATIEKVNNTCVKVYGLKDGEVVITATAGGKTAKYTLLVGNAVTTTTTTASPIGGVMGDPTTSASMTGDNIEVDLSLANDDQLSKFISENQQESATTIILGILGWTVIIVAFGLVLSVAFRNRTPQMNLFPGSRRRFNTGGYRGNYRKRLLPDHYYRSIRKY